MSEYPEHDKLAEVKDASQTIGEFLDFGLAQQGLALYEKVKMRDGYRDGRWVPTRKPIQAILAEYFDIDQNKIEAEKRAMLFGLRADAHYAKGEIDPETGYPVVFETAA